MLKANGISDPGKTLKNVRDMALQLEASNPALASDVRQSLALIHEAKSDYVARVNSWFDQTIERVGERFTKYTHYVTVGIAAVVVLAVQLDIIAVIDRLSVDDSFKRNTIVDSAIADFGEHSPAASTAGAAKKSDSKGGNSGTTQPAPATSQHSNTLGSKCELYRPRHEHQRHQLDNSSAAPPATDGLTITQEATSSSSSTQPAPAASNGTPGGAVPATTVAGTAGGTPTTGTSTGLVVMPQISRRLTLISTTTT